MIGKDLTIWRYAPSGEILGQNEVHEPIHQIWQKGLHYWVATTSWLIQFSQQGHEMARFKIYGPVETLIEHGSGYILTSGQMVSWLQDGRIKESLFLNEHISQVLPMNQNFIIQKSSNPPLVWHPSAPKLLRKIPEINEPLTTFIKFDEKELWCLQSGEVLMRKKGKTQWRRPIRSEVLEMPQVIPWGRKKAIALVTNSRTLSVLGSQGQELLHLRLDDRPTHMVGLDNGCLISLVSLPKLLFFNPEKKKIFPKTLPSHIVKAHSTLNWVAFLGYDRSVTLYKKSIPAEE